jgi:hypothetical protein
VWSSGTVQSNDFHGRSVTSVVFFFNLFNTVWSRGTVQNLQIHSIWVTSVVFFNHLTTVWSRGSDQSYDFHGKSVTSVVFFFQPFEPNATHCFCNAGPFKRIARHWTNQNHKRSQKPTEACPFTHLFQEFVKQRDPFTYVEQKFGDSVPNSDERHSEVEEEHNNRRQQQNPSTSNTLPASHTNTQSSFLSPKQQSAQLTSHTPLSENQSSANKRRPIIVVTDEGETIYEPNNNFCNGCQTSFKKITQHWSSNKQCNKSIIFQNNVSKGTVFSTRIQHWKDNILIHQEARLNQRQTANNRNTLRCPTCANVMKTLADQELRSPSCAAINKKTLSSECADQQATV